MWNENPPPAKFYEYIPVVLFFNLFILLYVFIYLFFCCYDPSLILKNN